MEAATCLSAVPVLRCLSFTTIQSIVLLIPTALELIFTTVLLVANWRSGRRFFLLTAEGWVYFSLALLDMLSHVVPAVRDSLTSFRIVDIVVGATSFLPILLFTLFLFFVTTEDLLESLPRRYQNAVRILLVVFIPTILALNALASFLNISYRMIPSATQMVIAVGFNRPQDQSIWFFLTALALALLTAYQALVWSFTFVRVVKAFLAQRRIETESVDEGYFMNGIGWLSAGVKLGAIETVAGLAQGGFNGAIIRRVIRLCSRACLCMGVIKGLDAGEDFSNLANEMRGNRSSFRRSRLFISNPRFSTFRQMSPSATEFHEKPRAAPGPSMLRIQGGLPNMSQLNDFKRDPKQRVTVHFQAGAPTLHMRFSALDLPSPALIVDNVNARPMSTIIGSRPGSLQQPTSEPAPQATPIFARHTRAFSEFSMPDSINSLVGQFPSLPARVTQKTQQPSWDDPYANNVSSLTRGASTASRDTVSSVSSRRKPVPPMLQSIDPFDDADDAERGDLYAAAPAPTQEVALNVARPNVHQRALSINTSTTGTPMTNLSEPYNGTLESAETTPATASDPFAYDNYPAALNSGKSAQMGVAVTAHRRISSDMVELRARLAAQSGLEAVQEYNSDEEGRNGSRPWLNNDNPVVRRRPDMPARIKSIGNVSYRPTPAPIRTAYTRGSIYIEPIMIPPKDHDMPQVELVQDDSVTSTYSSALRDSEVFGQDNSVRYR